MFAALLLSAAWQCVVPNGPVRAQVTTPDGRIVVAQDGALVVEERTGDASERPVGRQPGGVSIAITPCDGLPGAFPTALAAGGESVYVGFRHEGVWRWDAGGFSHLDMLGADVEAGGVRALAVAGDGLLVGTGTAGLFLRTSDGTVSHLERPSLATAAVFALEPTGKPGKFRAAFGPFGAFEVDPSGGALHVRKTASGFVGAFDAAGRPTVFGAARASESPGTARGLPTAHMTAAAPFGDRLYVGTFDGGLFATPPGGTPPPGVTFIPVAGVPPFVNTLLAMPDRLLIGTSQGLFTLPMGVSTEPAAAVPVSGITAHVNGLAVSNASPGHPATIAVATGDGAYLIEGTSLMHLGESQGLPSRLTWAVAYDAAGALWIGTSAGLVRLADDRPPETLSRATGHLPHDWVTALLPDGPDMLVGTYDAGAVRLSPDASQPAGFGHTTVVDAAWVNPGGLARVGGVPWVLTLGGGAGPLDPTGGFTPRSPAALNDVTAAAAFGGDVWLATRGGLIHGGATGAATGDTLRGPVLGAR